MPEHSARLAHAFAALLRGDDDASWTRDDVVDEVLAAAQEHDVVALLADRVSRLAEANPRLLAQLRTQSQRLAASDLASEVELRRLLATLDHHGVRALLIKGSHLAYSHYERPDLRARVDTDLLVSREQRDLTTRVLEQLGYVADVKPSGELTATQQLFVLHRHDAPIHLVDLHWRLASPQVFAHVLTFDDLDAASRPLGVLSSTARGPSSVHALIIACMHRVAHHHDEAEKLKWIYDIHLIATTLSPDEWKRFAEEAIERGVAAVCQDGLVRASEWLGTLVPRSVTARLGQRDGAPEATSAYLDDPTQARAVLANLRALTSWRQRARLAREHLVPSPTYMRQMYAPHSRLPLPVLYLLRIIRGAGAWVRRPNTRG